MEQESFDITVIGGGIAGIGVARECALAGYKVLLLERKSIAQATSANSLRIIHGGFRYLQSFNIPRVLESIRDQLYWLAKEPELVKPLPCLMPLERFTMRSKFPLQCAALLYRMLRAADNQIVQLPLPKVVSAVEATELCGLLTGHVPHGALLWYDAKLTDPNQFVKRRLEEIVGAGGEYRENSEVMGLTKSPDQVNVRLSNNTEIHSKLVVNTLGPWFGTLNANQTTAFQNLKWCKAFNVVFDTRIKLDVAFGLLCDQKRLLFLVPREDGKIALGTWYLPYAGAPDTAQVTTAESAELEECFTKQLGKSIGTRVQTELGILPMREVEQDMPVLYGAEQIFSHEARIIEVLSTKYTTFRSQGLKVLAKIKQTIGPKARGNN